jgi:aspartate/glutamate racemase
LKKEYADIYKMIKQVKLDDINGQLSKQIKELKAAGKDTIALYAQ